MPNQDIDRSEYRQPNSPPFVPERILSLLSTGREREAILGDFAEEFNQIASQRSPRRANFWYWLQLCQSAPSLGRLKMEHEIEKRGFLMRKQSIGSKRIFFIGFLLLIPTFLIAIPGLFQSALSITAPNEFLDRLYLQIPIFEILINPVIILGGLFLAFALNVSQIIRIGIKRQEDSLVGTVAARGNLLHWGVVLTCLLFALVILTYLLAENFQVFAR
jgi:hypothetical protein